MKKILKFTSIVAILFISMIALTACNVGMTPDKFKSTLEDKGYGVTDQSSSSLAADLGTREALLGSMLDESGNLKYNIYFFDFENDEDAKIGFDYLVEAFKKYETEDSDIKNNETNNTEIYTMLGAEYYTIISRVDNTIFYTDAFLQNKDVIVELAQELGY